MTEDEFRAKVASIIDRAPEHLKRRLEGIQWQCDQIRAKHGDNHMGATVEISRMMMDSLVELRASLVNHRDGKITYTNNVLDFDNKDDE